MNEIRIRTVGKDSTTIYEMSNIPFRVDLSPAEGGAIFMLEATKPVRIFSGNLTQKEYNRYKKEITALFKDFDEIFGEVNSKYRLKEQK